jgi:hypothetical protein
MSSTLFGRGTFLQTGNKQRQDQLDKQNAELRSFAVAATQEIQTLKAAMELVIQRLDAIEKRLTAPLTASGSPESTSQ